MKTLWLTPVLVGCALSCVSTQEVNGGPDPRASLAPLPGAPTELPAVATPTPAATSGPAVANTAVVAIAVDRPAVWLPSDSDPLVAVRIVFASGSRDDPPTMPGLTALTAKLMVEGGQRHNGEAIRAMMMPMAAELSVRVDTDHTAFVGRVHRDHADKYIELLVELLTAPLLDPVDFERLREAAIAEIEQGIRSDDDEQLQRQALHSTIFGGAAHPYRHLSIGSVEGLHRCTVAALADHRAAVFTQQRMWMGLAGGFAPAHADALRRGLGLLPSSSGVRPPLPPPPSVISNQMVVIDKPAAGTAISLGFALQELDRDHPDYVAMKVAETWFGEHRNLAGHLFHSMREVRGLNYGDYAYVESFEQAPGTTYDDFHNLREQQTFSMWIRPVQHQNRAFAVRMAAWELQRFVQQGIPSDEEFTRIVSFVQGYWPAKDQDASRRLGYAIDAMLSGQQMPHSSLPTAASKLTRREVNAAIARHLRADRLTFVVVTTGGEAFVQELLGKATPMTYATPPSPATRLEDEQIEGFDVRLVRSSVRVVKPSDLFQR
jgi:zinc protease